MKILAVGDFQGLFPRKLQRAINKEEFDLIVGVGDYGGISDWRPWVMQNLRDSKAGKPYLTAEEYFGKKGLKRLVKRDNMAAMHVLQTLDFGNGDDGWYTYKFSKGLPPSIKGNRKILNRLINFRDITYSSAKLKGINFVGFGGYMDIDAYFDKKIFPDAKKNGLRMHRRTKSRNNFLKRLKNIGNKNGKILVLHYPPKGAFNIIRDKKDNPMNGKSAGIGFFTEAIKKYKPKLVLCGHMHEYQGFKRVGNTIVVNPGDAEKGKYAIIDYPSNGNGKIKVRIVK